MICRRTLLGTMVALPATANHANDPSVYPLIRAKGSHRELGRQHGEQAAEYIKRHIDVMASGQKFSREKLQQQAQRFQPMFEKYCPHLMDEMRGLAEGARVTLPEAMACNIRGEIGNAPAEGCTTYTIARTITASKEVLAGQNSD